MTGPFIRCQWMPRIWLVCALLCLVVPAHAWDLSGVRDIIAVTRDQQQLKIGSVEFSPRSDGKTGFRVIMDTDRFKDFFLSMKEFKCLEGSGEVVCHVPYPYQHPGVIDGDNFVWLEHSLLFLFKQPRDFGAKLWNGLYYRFVRDASGLTGTPHAVDLNVISAPPDDLRIPPYRIEAQDAVVPDSRFIAGLKIR